MLANSCLQLFLYLAALTALALPLGWYMARVYSGNAGLLQRVLGPLERLLYRVAGVRDTEQTWKQYALAMLVFNVAGLLVVYALQRLQGILPQNPQTFDGVTADSAFNTAVSFATNTNWQGYGGESTLSYLTQMLALTVQNFVSAAAGIAVLVALIRGFTRREVKSIGNFWVDLTRSTLYILLPLSVVLAMVLVWQGVPQTFSAYPTVKLVQPVTYEQVSKGEKGVEKKETITVTEQSIAVGPVASQVAIKQLGTNGGGFFNVNSAHPFENPTPLSNALQVLAILLIPAALCFTFGEMVADRRQGAAIYIAMMLLFVFPMMGCTLAEQSGNPAFTALGVDQTPRDTATALGEVRADVLATAPGNPPAATQSGGNMEGKEVRFGIANSALWAVATTAASNGSVNSMHDSFTPLGGMIPMFMIQLGEVVFGGVGSGLYGMLVFAILTVFVSGLMVGRTPEYLGKKIEAYEMKMASIVILIPPLVVLIGTAIGVVCTAGTSSLANPGAHGFSEALYAFSSAGNNNGSAFAGLSANTVFYNLLLGIIMFLARYWLAIPVLAIAGSLAAKKSVPAGAGTLSTHTPLFVALLIGIVLLVGALSFLPSLALGPLVEHLQMTK